MSSNKFVENGLGLSIPQQMVSSCVGGLITSVFMTPFDVVKVRLQTQQTNLLNQRCKPAIFYCTGLIDHICNCSVNGSGVTVQNEAWQNRPIKLNGTIDAFVKITRSEGLRALWSGLSPTMIVAMPNTILYLTTYEYILRSIKRLYHPQEQPVWAGGLAGGGARTWAVILFSPLELLRTRIQAKNISYKEVSNVIRKDIKISGLSSLWRGCIATVYRDVPFSVLYWMSYENMKKIYCPQQQPSLSFTLLAGAVSGGMAGAITLPLDVVKTYQQVEIEKKISSRSTTSGVLLHIYKQQGVKGLFTGVVPRMAKIMPACGIMISSYEYAKNYFRTRNKCEL